MCIQEMTQAIEEDVLREELEFEAMMEQQDYISEIRKENKK